MGTDAKSGTWETWCRTLDHCTILPIWWCLVSGSVFPTCFVKVGNTEWWKFQYYITCFNRPQMAITIAEFCRFVKWTLERSNVFLIDKMKKCKIDWFIILLQTLTDWWNHHEIKIQCPSVNWQDISFELIYWNMIENNDKDKNDVNGPDSHWHVCILHEKGHFFEKSHYQKKKKKKKNWWKTKVLSHFV